MSSKGLPTVKSNLDSQAGFTMMETMISIIILTVGLLALAAAISYAVTIGSVSRNITESKTVIISTLDQIDALAKTKRLSFSQIANVGSVENPVAPAIPFSGFLNPRGGDNAYGTADDTFQAIYLEPGADGIYGTADDSGTVRAGFTRNIFIEQLDGNPYLKKITVTVRYPGSAGKQMKLTGVSYLNDDTRGVYIP